MYRYGPTVTKPPSVGSATTWKLRRPNVNLAQRNSRKATTCKPMTSVEDEKGAKIFTFVNPVDEFPQRIVYRRTEHEWLFAQVAGTVEGQKKEVTYPMQHVDCATGAFVDK